FNAAVRNEGTGDIKFYADELFVMENTFKTGGTITNATGLNDGDILFSGNSNNKFNAAVRNEGAGNIEFSNFLELELMSNAFIAGGTVTNATEANEGDIIFSGASANSFSDAV